MGSRMRLDQLKPVPKRNTWTVTRALAHSEALHPPKITLPRLIWMEEPYGQKPAVEHVGPGGKARLSPRARRKERAAEIRAEIDDAADLAGQGTAISPASGGQESQSVPEEELGLEDGP